MLTCAVWSYRWFGFHHHSVCLVALLLGARCGSIGWRCRRQIIISQEQAGYNTQFMLSLNVSVHTFGCGNTAM